MYGLEAPAVGLLNNGTEQTKGTPLQIEANRRLAACEEINYVGNVEGNAVPFGACDVLVTDGFTGNVFLKTMEGVGKLLLKAVKDVFMTNGLTKLSALLVKKSFSGMKKVLIPALMKCAKADLNLPKAGLCFWMKSAKSIFPPKSNCCGCWKAVHSSGWAARKL